MKEIKTKSAILTTADELRNLADQLDYENLFSDATEKLMTIIEYDEDSNAWRLGQCQQR